jgi:hypothetical protein
MVTLVNTYMLLLTKFGAIIKLKYSRGALLRTDQEAAQTKKWGLAEVCLLAQPGFAPIESIA